MSAVSPGQQRLEYLTQENSQLCSYLSVKEGELCSLRAKAAENEKVFLEATANFGDERMRLEAENAELLAAVLVIQKERDDLRRENAALRKRITLDDAAERIDTLAAHDNEIIEKYEADAAVLVRDNENLLEEVKRLKNLSITLAPENVVGALEAETTELRDRVRGLELSLADRRSGFLAAIEKIEKELDALNELKLENAKLRAAVRDLAGAKSCPNCTDNCGFTVRQFGFVEDGSYGCEQEQCEFCWLTLDSVHNVTAKHAAIIAKCGEERDGH